VRLELGSIFFRSIRSFILNPPSVRLLLFEYMTNGLTPDEVTVSSRCHVVSHMNDVSAWLFFTVDDVFVVATWTHRLLLLLLLFPRLLLQEPRDNIEMGFVPIGLDSAALDSRFILL
jgi:hypothetical protein